jgi:threonine aldolase
VVFPQKEVEAICSVARDNNISTYLDGARLWNAAIATGLTVSELARPFDAAMVALSKGLGAPGGSLLVGSDRFIKDALRYRRMFGGAMRQIGYFATAAQYALDHNMERLQKDHENARRLAELLAKSDRIEIDLASVQTNIMVFHLSDEAPDAASVIRAAKAQGVLVNMFGPRTLRALTHLDVSTEQCDRAANIISEIVGQ